MDWEDRIEVNPLIMLGKPVIKGTRITVELILERLQAGETMNQIVNSLRNIDANDVQAAIEYALESVRKEKVYVIPGELDRMNVSRIPKDYQAEETNWGEPCGKEAW